MDLTLSPDVCASPPEAAALALIAAPRATLARDAYARVL
jgi:hypothetical protein